MKLLAVTYTIMILATAFLVVTLDWQHQSFVFIKDLNKDIVIKGGRKQIKYEDGDQKNAELAIEN